MRRAVELYLSSRRPRRGELKGLAATIGVSTRALRKWRARAAGPVRPAHRPKSALPDWARLRKIARAWRALARGHQGFRELCAALWRAGIDLGARLSQRIVGRLKHSRAARALRRAQRERVHVTVLARDALWACDESFLDRDRVGEVRGLLVRETFVPCTLWLSVGPPACGADLVSALSWTAEQRGGWPLVLVVDNGAINTCGDVLDRLEREHVLVLYNVPHTPQHNPCAERGWGELKCACGPEECGSVTENRAMAQAGAVISLRARWAGRLRAAWQALDGTPRWKLGGFTPAEIDALAPRADDLVCRACFYADAQAALARVAQQGLAPRARRRAEREAIWSTLEMHGLVLRTRGGGRSS